MALSGAEQNEVQKAIDAAPLSERDVMRAEAESTLAQINAIMGSKILTKEESKAADFAVEFLVRLEATSKSKGWWFRAKRRLQLVQMYLGS